MNIRTLLLMVCLLAGMTGARAAAPVDAAADRQQVQAILAAHDRLRPGIEQYLASVADDVILMPNGARTLEGKPAYRRHVEEFYDSGDIRIRHEVLETYSYPEVVIVRGRAVGTFAAPGQPVSGRFETQNLFVFRRTAGGKLEVWQIIFNNVPVT